MAGNLAALDGQRFYVAIIGGGNPWLWRRGNSGGRGWPRVIWGAIWGVIRR